MFDRYTEKAKRAIFFARYEASQFGSPYIETEHLLLGLLREDKALVDQFLPSHSAVESIRHQVEAHTETRERVSTSVDLPLSHGCKRALAYGAEEAERLTHRHIGTPHLFLGLLREEGSLAAQLLREQGISQESIRLKIRQLESSVEKRESAVTARVGQWLAEFEAGRGIWVAKQERVANSTTDFAIYAGDLPSETENDKGDPVKELAKIKKRLDHIVVAMESAIASHEFEKARFYSDEERRERENFRLLREQFNLEEPASQIPLLCIEIILDDSFSSVQKRCDDFIAAGVGHVWMLNAKYKRAYTATKTEGLREVKGEILRIDNPPLEMDLKKIFA